MKKRKSTILIDTNYNKLYLDNCRVYDIPISIYHSISKNLKAGNLVTFRGMKAIKWFNSQKLMGVYDGNYGIINSGIVLVNKNDYKKFVGNK